MNAPDRVLDWTDANQRLLVAEFARLAALLQKGAPDDAAQRVATQRAAMPAPAAIDTLATQFHLSDFERDLLLLTAAVEMDAHIARLCAQGDMAPQPWASFGLALAVLPQPHWSALAPVGPLRRWRLVEVDDTAGLTRGRLRIDERILHYIAGVNYLDTRLHSLLRAATPPTAMADPHRSTCQLACEALSAAQGHALPVVWLDGDDAAGQTDVAAEVAVTLGLRLHVLRAIDVPAHHADTDALATLWAREARLLDSALLVSAGLDALPAAVLRLIDSQQALVFVSASQHQALERPLLRYTVDKPGPQEQKRLWQQVLGADAQRVQGALDSMAGQFKLSAHAIATEGRLLAPVLAASAQPEACMWSVCRAMGRAQLDTLAQRMDARAGWDDLVLPDAQKAVLQHMGAHVRHRLQVHLDWGFADQGGRGLGLSALFAGESGTGKTMAAEVLARELQLDLYRIDLSAVVSKYIGETEKNLRRVFDAAEDSGAMLLFDEADALFGKRSEVKDSHDRYANIEVGYLLQRMEAYRGLAILTTNLKTALDPAFQRRLRFVVQFPFPDLAQREAIWRRAFPARMPVDGIDPAKLARLNVTGGSIRNIALNAAFRAADQGQAVSMTHLLHAAQHEAGKQTHALSDAETRGWT